VAAAPEGGALACPSASPHLPVFGAGNSAAVASFARQGAKRADSAIRTNRSFRESQVRRDSWKTFLYATGVEIFRSSRPKYLFNTKYY
jgi:hypothetical protein